MKYILKTPLLIMCFIIILIMGYFIGFDISKDFLNLYVSKLSQLPTRYILLVLIIFTNYLVFDKLNCTAIIVRKKSFFSFLLNVVKTETIVLFLLFIFLHLPIFILNSKYFFDNICLIAEIIINGAIVSLALISLIKILDIKIKNRAITSGIVLIIFSMMDLILEHFNFFIANQTIFDFSFIFILPYNYKFYYVIALTLILFIIFLTALSVVLTIKKDYFLDGNYEEN